ncbi:MAG: 2TM domain-containing protein [Gaiellaceae bacterium]
MSVVTSSDGRHVSEHQPAPDVDDSREQAIANLKRKRKFAEDAVAYLAVNGVLWLVWLISDRSADGSIPWPAWVSIVWGFLLALDAWRAFGSWPRSLHRPITEAEIGEEISRSRR